MNGIRNVLLAASLATLSFSGLGCGGADTRQDRAVERAERDTDRAEQDVVLAEQNLAEARETEAVLEGNDPDAVERADDILEETP